MDEMLERWIFGYTFIGPLTRQQHLTYTYFAMLEGESFHRNKSPYYEDVPLWAEL